MSLKTRFSLLAIALILVASTVTWWSFQWVATGIIEQWGHRVADIQVRYDSARLLQPLERDIALAHKMADTAAIKQWARNPDNPDLKHRAMQELESFRRNFRDRNYFVALAGSGAYYHNNAESKFEDDPLRYHLDPESPGDAWFYEFIEEGRDYHLNVNPDRELDVTRLWIDVAMRDDNDRVLGIVGTGLHLNNFLSEAIDTRQPGITSLFVDSTGAIQLYRDTTAADLATQVRPEGQKTRVVGLLDSDEDRRRVSTLMDSLKDRGLNESGVRSQFVTADGERHLMGIAYLPRIGWYEVTLIDLDVLMPVSRFAPVIAVFALVLLLCLFVFHLTLRRQILNPITALEAAMKRVRDGDLSEPKLPRARGEVGRLIQHFASMAGAIRNHTLELENKVRERTEALHTLARIDPLTELVNRRGMNEILLESIERASRYSHTFGVIWLDLDHFKALNDSRGHAAGDDALIMVADVLRESLRPYDRASRWGGDEFLIMLSPCDEVALETIGERIRGQLADKLERSGWPITASLGGYLTQPGDSQDIILQRADEAMYRAKLAGRNCFIMARRP